MPELVPVYRQILSGTASTAPKSLITVGRIALMGVGQLGATTVMVWSTRSSAAWTRFWAWATLTAGAKMLFVCIGFARAGRGVERWTLIASLVTVALFLAASAGWWWRGELSNAPSLGTQAKLWLALSFALWAALALAPRFAAA